MKKLLLSHNFLKLFYLNQTEQSLTPAPSPSPASPIRSQKTIIEYFSDIDPYLRRASIWFPYITLCEYTFALHFLIPHFNMRSFQFYLPSPTSLVIGGHSCSRKTCFVFTCLKPSLIQPFPTRIILFYKEWQTIYDRINQILPQTEFEHGIDNEISEKIQASEKNLVLLDDLMTSAEDSKRISKLFTQEAHQKNLTVIFIVQNVFYHGREMRTISINAH